MSDTPGWSAPDQQPNQPQDHAQGQAQQQQQPPPGYAPPGYGPGYYVPPPPTIKPGVIPLRPLAVGEIIDGAITTMRKYPVLLIGAAAVVATVTQVLGLLIQLPFLKDLTDVAATDPSTLSREEAIDQALGAVTSVFTGALLSGLLVLLGTVFLSGFITVVVGHAVLGEPVTFKQAWDEFRPRFLPLLGATPLYALVVIVASIGLFVPGVWVYVLFSLFGATLVLERCGILTAFRRSKALVTGAWWRTFGILLLAWLISTIVGSIISMPFGVASMVSTGFSPDPTAALSLGSLVLSAIGGIVASTITLPFTASVNVLVYVDRRMRAEGMDIELQRAAGHGGS